MTSAQETRADGWQRDTAQRNATVAGLARENRQLREQLAAKGLTMTEPVPGTDAFADARDRITWQNAAVKAERERIRQLAADRNAIVVLSGEPCAWVPFADLIEETTP